MPEPRLTTALQVHAMLRTASHNGVFGVVVRRGDPTSGTILVQLRTRAGNVVLSRLSLGGDGPEWLRATGPDPVPDGEADTYVARVVGRDPDAWVVEFETAGWSLPFPGRIAEPRERPGSP